LIGGNLVVADVTTYTDARDTDDTICEKANVGYGMAANSGETVVAGVDCATVDAATPLCQLQTVSSTVAGAVFTNGWW